MIEIMKMNEAAIPEIAPLVAQFRVSLKSFKGIRALPDPEAGASELREYLSAGFPVYTAKADEPCVWAESVYVLPEYRRQGVAGALFQKAEELAASYGEDTVYNCVHPNNTAMIAFLKAKGYSVLNLIEIRKAYDGERLTRKIRVDESLFDY